MEEDQGNHEKTINQDFSLAYSLLSNSLCILRTFVILFLILYISKMSTYFNHNISKCIFDEK